MQRVVMAAQPAHLQRLVVVVVVCIYLLLSAHLTRAACDLALADGVVELVPRRLLAGIDVLGVRQA
jgi:hypothetical protein